MKLYLANGSEVNISGSSGSSDALSAGSDLAVYTDGDGTNARSGTISINGSKFYPTVRPDRIEDKLKKWSSGVCLMIGDSYMQMNNTTFTDFATRHGLVCDGLWLSSSTIAGDSAQSIGYHPFHERLDEAVTEYESSSGRSINGTRYHLSDVKLIVMMGGANDWHTQNDEIDRIGQGPDETDPARLYGALNKIFQIFLEKFTKAIPVIILQPTNNNLENIKSMVKKEKVVREMAELYGLPICDCCFTWYSPINPDDKVKYWQSDNLHMTAAGTEEIINRLEHTVNNLSQTR